MVVEMIPNGALKVFTNNSNQECSIDSVTLPNMQVLSNLKNYTDGIAYFDGTWSGEVLFKEDKDLSMIESNLILRSLNENNQIFELEILLPSCDAPSMSPTLVRSQVPSNLPTLGPSLIASGIPSLKPSVVPSMSPSSLPSIDNKCPIEEVSGKTYFFKITASCLKVELFVGGKLSILRTNEECSGSFSSPPIETAVSFYESSSGEKAVFSSGSLGTNGWDGDLFFLQNAISDSIETNVNLLDTLNQIFSVDVILPSCQAPSLSPSTAPNVA